MVAAGPGVAAAAYLEPQVRQAGTAAAGGSRGRVGSQALRLCLAQQQATHAPHRSAQPPRCPSDLRDGPGGSKLIGKQIDYHSFESIL